MSTYTVVITPDSDDGNAPGGQAQATIRVETNGTAPRITEMTIRSIAPGGLSTHDLPQIDLAAIVRALASGIRRVAPEPGAARPRQSGQETDQPSRSRQRKKAALEASSAVSRLAEQTELSLPETASAARAKPVDTGRPYRRMPDAEEIIATYERIGTVTGLAEHYGVPRHTAQGWMGRARKLSSQ
jgi:hypothetical protein